MGLLRQESTNKNLISLHRNALRELIYYDWLLRSFLAGVLLHSAQPTGRDKLHLSTH